MDATRRGLLLGGSAAGAALIGLSSQAKASVSSSSPASYSFDVVEQGADPSGTADSTQAFKATIALAASAGTGGGVVLVPSGRYLIAETLILPNYITLRGPGTPHSATLDFANQQAGAGLRLTGYGHIGVEGLCVANTAGNGVEIDDSGSISYRNFCHLRDVLVVNAGGSGFVAKNSYMCSFERCWAREANDFGFRFLGFHTSLKLDTCWADSCGQTGFSLNSVVYSTLNNCGADSNNGYGYFLSNCQGIALTGCGAESNFYSSIGMAASAAWGATAVASEPHLKGITITSFFSLLGNTGGGPAYGSFMSIFSQDGKKVEGSSLNHHTFSDTRGIAEVKKTGSASDLDFPVYQGSRLVG